MDKNEEVQWLNHYQCGTRNSQHNKFNFHVIAKDFTEASKTAARTVSNYNHLHGTDYSIYELSEVPFYQ